MSDEAEPSDEQFPPLAITGPHGTRQVVRGIDSATTVGALADALGIPAGATVLIDGRAVHRAVRVHRSGIRHGSSVTAGTSPDTVEREADRMARRNTCAGRAERRPGRAIETGRATPTAAIDVADGPRRFVPSSGPAGATEPATPVAAVVLVECETGPAVSPPARLAPGRHVIGRAAGAAVRLLDDAVELHHGVLDVDADGARFTQLTGRTPCDTYDREGGSRRPHVAVTLGASRLRIGPLHAAPAHASAALKRRPSDPWRATLHRTPRQQSVWMPAPIDVPDAERALRRASGVGVAGALASLIGGVVVAAVMRNPMFLVFSAVGALVALATRLGVRSTECRRGRRVAAERRRAVGRFADEVAARRDAWAAFHRAAAPTIGDALDDLGLGRAIGAAGEPAMRASVWNRRAGHDDAFRVVLGWGEVTADLVADSVDVPVDCELMVTRAARFEHLPVTADLGHGQALALAGTHAAAVARSLLVQLATWCGPADWRLVVVASEPREWAWVKWLPHAVDRSASVHPADDLAGLADAVAGVGAGHGHIVLVNDRPDLMASCTGPLRRFLAAAPSVATVTVVGRGEAVPASCTCALTTGTLCAGRWCPDTGDATVTSAVRAAGITIDVAAAAARRLASLHDPEDASGAGELPRTVTLAQLLAKSGQGPIDDPIAVAARWRRADGHPVAVLGATGDGVVAIDLVRDGPHALVAGTTGSGKSELLRTMVASIAAGSSPDDVTFVLVDYKGGSTFDACRELPHTVGLVTDLDDRLAARAIRSLDAEIRRRERLLRATGAGDLEAYREAPGAAVLPRLVVVIDEFAALALELPTFLSSLVGVAQRGRSLGIHLVLATQRPAGVVNDDIRANTNIRIALRLNDRHDAVDVVGTAAPSELARDVPGRAVVRLGPEEVVTFQTACSSGPPGRTDRLVVIADELATRLDGDDDLSGASTVSELVMLARTIRSAASLCEVAPPRRPWLEPLPAVLTGDEPELAACSAGPDSRAVGVVDDPDHQRMLPLRWDGRNGNLLVVGGHGMGATTALRSVVLATAATWARCYVIDARGDSILHCLRALPTCAGVVGVHDTERRGRVVRTLIAELARRQSSRSDTAEPLLLAVDGLPTLLGALAEHEADGERDAMRRVLADGVAVGIRCVATAERPGALAPSVLASFAERWLLHIEDPLDASAVGVRAAAVPPSIPGRVVVASTQLDAQLVPLDVSDLPAEQAAEPTACRSVAPVAVLAPVIDACTLPPSTASDGATNLVLGHDFASLGPAPLGVPDGEHAVILGPPRSGRSTALVRIVAAWRDAQPGGRVVVLAPRPRCPLTAWAAGEASAVTVATSAADVLALLDAAQPTGRLCVAVDDAERVDDPSAALAALIERHDPGLLVVAAGRPDALRTMYGHWTAIVRRSRVGMVMTLGTDADGDLLGEVLPRRLPIPARRGLAWIIDADGRRLVQVAFDQQAAPA